MRYVFIRKSKPEKKEGTFIQAFKERQTQLYPGRLKTIMIENGEPSKVHRASSVNNLKTILKIN